MDIDEDNMRGSRKFCQRGSNFDVFFFNFDVFFRFFFSLMKGRRVQIPLLAGHHRPRQRNAIQMEFRWHADDGPTLNAGFVAL